MSIIIIGGGQAAASLVAKYRALGGEAKVTIIGEEPHYPYQRPPLSKKYLSGELPLERLFLRPSSWYKENGVEFRADTKVVRIDRLSKSVALEIGEILEYEKLVFATGSRPRRLPESISQNANSIYTVRSIADVDAMRAEFKAGQKLLVVGGGYVGLEAAAIARKFDVEVTVLEAAPRILGRVASEATADFIRELHRANGVEICEGIGLEALVIENRKVVGAKLSDERVIATDFVIVGIGILPNMELAENAGIKCENGILVDALCRTNDPNIYAAGDCARIHYQDKYISIESVGNAIDQGEVVAANLANQETEYVPKPWFWSDQFDMTLQIAGLNIGYDETVLRHGKNERAQSVWYYKNEQLIAIDAMNDPRAYMAGKKIIESGKNIPKNAVANPETNLKDWV